MTYTPSWLRTHPTAPSSDKKAAPVMRCPRCGITVFTHEDNVEGYCTDCDRARHG